MTVHAWSCQAVPAGVPEHHHAVEIQTFGFWIYLMSDLILFSTLFATFAVLGQNTAGGPTGKDLFDLPYLFGETLLLLFSSATYGMAMLAMQDDCKAVLLLWLGITFLFGLGFVCMEVNEFHGMIAAGNGPARSGFLSAFFTLVGTHGAHVTAGLIWMAVMIGQVLTKGLTTPVRSRLARLSMFWHFLDIVWIGVFSWVYLMGVL
ncbi:cytochrome o ubiquinol oxidase subunit III [Desulfosarcina cetonica]|uniref:cytochrome o ubiquinol oxidase subunit III n=1 Tax=Desulfosarcina cetonica TaxID=90730 RepID=UPI0006CF47F4|nr:cytochrome o ubiquinol oxidase subunit III [Desulfosarcina cetonica]VTR71380.1 cytochrome o ubiquinol oxidase subunit III [Desulfosarcina cetonica]